MIITYNYSLLKRVGLHKSLLLENFSYTTDYVIIKKRTFQRNVNLLFVCLVFAFTISAQST